MTGGGQASGASVLWHEGILPGTGAHPQRRRNRAEAGGRQRPPDDLVPWLYRVVRNGALNAARAARRRRHYEAAAAARAPAWFVASEAPGLDVRVTTAALQALPAEQREVIIAHIWGGLT